MKFPFLLNSVYRCRNSKDVEQVFGKLIRALPTLEGSIVSNCLNILSKKEINHPKSLWRETAEILTSNCNGNSNSNSILSKYDVRDVCIILNSFAKVDHLFPKLIDNSTKIITQQIRNVHTRDLCNVIHSLGKLNQITPLSKIINKLFKDYEHELDDANKIYDIIEGCNETDFSMLLRVFLINSECLKFDSITNKLLKSMSDKFDNLSDQTLAILANSVALYGKDDNGTLSILSPIITLRLRGCCFTPQCVAQISNGYARLNVADKELFSALAKRVLFDVSEFPPRSLANVLNGFSKLGIFHRDLFVASIPQFTRNLNLMTPQCVANTINSYTKFSSHFDRELLVPFFNKLIDAVLGFTNFDSFIGQNYANILNGVSRLYMQGFLSSEQRSEVSEHQEELKVFELFSKLSKPMMMIVNKLNHLDVLMITNSMSRCRVIDLELLEKMLEKLKLFAGKYKCLEMVNILNSLAILYSCKDPENVETVYINSNTSSVGDLSKASNKGIYDSLLTYYLYFVDYFVSNLNRYKNIRPLDIRLVFKSLGKCNTYKEEYCDRLVDKYLELDQFNPRDLSEIAKYYSMMNVQVPEKLHKCAVEYLENIEQKQYNNQQSTDNSQQMYVSNKELTLNEVIDRMNQLM